MNNLRPSCSASNTYRSYLVRFWQTHEQGGWRASAQCVQTGNTVLFGDIENLLTFLQTEVKLRSQDEEAGTLPRSSCHR